MLVNVFRQMPLAIPGTRLLEATMDLIGVRISDPDDPRRAWEVQGLYLPADGRAVGGIRAKLMDQKGFVTFCNQRDFEVLLGLGRPGSPCEWCDDEYVGPDSKEWYGFCADDDDLLDDLQDRELLCRAEMPGGILVPNLEMTRRVHLETSQDFEELFHVLRDFDPDTGTFPDTNFETIERRWVRSERKRVRWDRS